MLWDLEKYQNNIAIIDEYGQTITYGELKEKGEHIMAAAGGRCLIFSLCQNTIGSVIGYVSFLNAGIVPVLLNAHLEKELLEGLLAAYQPQYLDAGGTDWGVSRYGAGVCFLWIYTFENRVWERIPALSGTGTPPHDIRFYRES